MKPNILIADDDPSMRRMLKVVLSEEYDTRIVEDGHLAVSAVEDAFYDLILMDVRMEGMDGLDALGRIKTLSPGIPVIIMTAYASVDTAVQAMKRGAFDYLTKPLDIDELRILLERALEHARMKQENIYLKQRLDDHFKVGNIVARSPEMIRVMETVAQVSPTDATILITGESGTGKEIIANALHQNSPRRDHTMVVVNCAALPESLLESELFGHEKGAFTGADRRKPGRFRMAHGSSIFLDEIGEMPVTTQAKILRVLQERTFEPVGGSETIEIDTRVIAATNNNLTEAVASGRFREDLYYRLNVINIRLPPLRERKEDIPFFVDFFLKKYVEKNRKLVKSFNSRALDLLMRYDWPGNVRELENMVERAVILTRKDTISKDDLPSILRKGSSVESGEKRKLTPLRSLKEVERDMILRTLEQTGGNRTHAAEILGISRRTLQLKLKAYGVQ